MGPSFAAYKTGETTYDGKTFCVLEIIEDEPRKYLKLADGRGWVFSHSKASEEICTEMSFEEAISEFDQTIRDPSIDIPKGKCKAHRGECCTMLESLRS